MDGGYLRAIMTATDNQTAESVRAPRGRAKPATSLRQSAAVQATDMKATARVKRSSSVTLGQATLWQGADMPQAYDLMNRRRSLIRRLDHLLEDATNEQFLEATVVLRDALERLRLALLKDTQLP